MSIAISILQKYSSNQESATQTYDDDQNFNTTKVLFKHDITAYTFYKAIIFQYYKSTLQTLEPAIKEKIETQFQYYKSTLQTWSQLSFFNSSLTYFNTTKVLFKHNQKNDFLCYFFRISILQKYSSN